MSERKRVIGKPEQPKIEIAEPHDDIIWRDETLKTPFDSDPSIVRLGGKAELEQALAYNLIYDETIGKWRKMETAEIATVHNKAYFYTADPPDLNALGFENMRLDKQHRLHVVNRDIVAEVPYSKYTYNVVVDTNTHIEIDLLDELAYGYSIALSNIVNDIYKIELSYKFPNDDLYEILKLRSEILPLQESHNIAPYSKFDLYIYSDVDQTCTFELIFYLKPINLNVYQDFNGRIYRNDAMVASRNESPTIYAHPKKITKASVIVQLTAGASFTFDLYACYSGNAIVQIYTNIFIVSGFIIIDVPYAEYVYWSATTDGSTTCKYVVIVI